MQFIIVSPFLSFVNSVFANFFQKNKLFLLFFINWNRILYNVGLFFQNAPEKTVLFCPGRGI